MSESATDDGGPYAIAIADSGLTFDCRRGDTLLRAALRAGLGFPYECGTGSCGTCRFELRHGEFDMAWPDAPGWSARDRQRRRMLGCQAMPRGAATIAVRLDSARNPRIVPTLRSARLSAVRAVTHDLWQFEFHAGGAAQFLPGQYALLSLPGVPGWRAYSMSNLANDEGAWRFVIKRKQGGSASGVLFDRPPVGLEVRLDGPFGHAFLAPESAAPVLCIAGGSGLSPMLAILAAALRRSGDAPRATTLFYGARRPEDIVDLAQFDMLAAAPAAIDYRVALSAVDNVPPEIWPGARGMVHEVVEREIAAIAVTSEVFVAGPPAMAEVTVAMLRHHGVAPERIHFDSFF